MAAEMARKAADALRALTDCCRLGDGAIERSRLDIGEVAEDGPSHISAGAKETRAGDLAVRIGGKGIGGNASARSDGSLERSREAAEALEAALDDLEGADLLDDLPIGHIGAGQIPGTGASVRFTEAVGRIAELNGSEVEVEVDIGKANGAGFPSFTVAGIADGGTSDEGAQDLVKVGGGGIGGNARAGFDGGDYGAAAQQFEGFLDARQRTGDLDEFLTGCLEVEDAFRLLTWNGLADRFGAESSKEVVSGVGANVKDDALVRRTYDDGDLVATIGREGVGGSAVAKFGDDEAARDAFGIIAEDMVDSGLAPILFDDDFA